MDLAAYSSTYANLTRREPVTATKEGDAWSIPGLGGSPPVIPDQLPGFPMPGMPSGGGGAAPSPGDPDYIPPGGDIDPAWPELPPPPGGGIPGFYTQEDLEKAREDGRREEQAKFWKQTAGAAVVSALVGYGIAKVLP